MKRIILISAVFLSVSGPTRAASDCKSAIAEYNSAVDEVDYTLKRYTRCLGASAGSDDCSSEFRKLKFAQDEFETAVSGYQSECH